MKVTDDNYRLFVRQPFFKIKKRKKFYGIPYWVTILKSNNLHEIEKYAKSLSN